MIERDARRAALGWLAGLIVLWGGNYTWVAIAVRDMEPLAFNLLRYMIAAAGFAGVALIAGWRLLPAPGERLGLGVIGLLQAGLMTWMTALALTRIPSAQVVLIAYSVPVWALIWGRLLLGEAITAGAALGAALGLAGIVVLSGAATGAASDPALGLGSADALGIGAAVLGVNGWALGAVLYRRRAWASPFWPQVWWQIAVTALATAALVPLVEGLAASRLSTPALAVGLWSAVGPLLLGFYCWAQALSRVPASLAGQVLILSPVFGVLQSHLVLGEPIGPSLLAAGALILAGAWLALRA